MRTACFFAFVFTIIAFLCRNFEYNLHAFILTEQEFYLIVKP